MDISFEIFQPFFEQLPVSHPEKKHFFYFFHSTQSHPAGNHSHVGFPGKLFGKVFSKPEKAAMREGRARLAAA
ncbi:MAG: hypothetical protein WC777_05720 [Candidatus Gracilibacteria bacterium]